MKENPTIEIGTKNPNYRVILGIPIYMETDFIGELSIDIAAPFAGESKLKSSTPREWYVDWV